MGFVLQKETQNSVGGKKEQWQEPAGEIDVNRRIHTTGKSLFMSKDLPVQFDSIPDVAVLVGDGYEYKKLPV